MSMKRAVILAGGRGTRLRPYTISLPKPLMPIGDSPILEIIIRQLAKQGFEHITLAVNHQADLMRAYFGDGSKWQVKIDYSLEDKPLSTVGPLKLIRDLPDHFLVMNGDLLTDLVFSDYLAKHEHEDRLFTVFASPREQKIDYGVLVLDEQKRLIKFEEKPSTAYFVSMGIYCVSRRILDWIPDGQPYGFDQLLLALLAKNEPIVVEPHNGYWLDIGRPGDYEQAIDDWSTLSGRINL